MINPSSENHNCRLNNHFFDSYRTFPKHNRNLSLSSNEYALQNVSFPTSVHTLVLIRTLLALDSKNSLSQPGLQLIHENVTNTT